MCDGFGQRLHTRLNVKNTSSRAQKVLVQDSYAKVVYDPTDVISPGKGTLVHLTSARQTPARKVRVHAEGGVTGEVSVAASPCPPPPTDPTTPTTEKPPPTHTTDPTSPTTPTVPINPGGGPPVAGPGVVNMPGGVPSSGSGAVQKAASGTLPFTGSDMRLYALLGNLLVLIGFGLLLLSHRKRHGLALFKRLTPQPIPVDPS
jgi:hypothetical protein